MAKTSANRSRTANYQSFLVAKNLRSVPFCGWSGFDTCAAPFCLSHRQAQTGEGGTPDANLRYQDASLRYQRLRS